MGMEKPAVCGGIPVRDTKLFYGHQYIDEADIQAVVDVLKSDYLTCGPKIGELEKNYARLQALNMRWYAVTERRPCTWPVWRPE